VILAALAVVLSLYREEPPGESLLWVAFRGKRLDDGDIQGASVIRGDHRRNAAQGKHCSYIGLNVIGISLAQPLFLWGKKNGSQTTICSINEHLVDYRIVWRFSEAYSSVIPARASCLFYPLLVHHKTGACPHG
jgi:hypothetical protein